MAAMLTCAIFVTVFATNDAEASLPTYAKGDKFALKGEKDLSLGYYSVNQLFTFGDDDTWFRNMVIDNASMKGYMSSVMFFEVVDVTDDEYVMKVAYAQNLTLAIKYFMTGELVNPGEYITYWDYSASNPDDLINISDADTTIGTVGIDAKLAMGANGTYIVHMQKSDMAIKSVEMTSFMYARGYFEAKNLPNVTEDEEGEYPFSYIETMTIGDYESYKINISLDLNLSGHMSFNPYITAIQDNPAEGSTWEVETFVNGSYTFAGMLDITGLPERITDRLFTNDTAEWGITGFPIDLAKTHAPADMSDDFPINNGTIEISDYEMGFEFCNIGNKVINDPVYGNITIYRLGFGDDPESSELEVWYYPAEGYLVGIELNYPLYYFGAKMKLDMKSVSVDDAKKAISDISDQVSKKKTYDQIDNAADKKGSDLMSFLPIIAVIAVAIVAVVGVFFVMKRKSKPKA